MYKIAFIFRKTAQPNIFREIILKALSSDFSDYLICSAFFQEPYINKKGKLHGKFSTSTDIIKVLQVPCSHRKKLNIYGVYGKGYNLQFSLFCQELFQAQRNYNFQCKFYQFNNSSHAKIFFAKEDSGEIKLAIIGSSNLSAGAFADRLQKQGWNHESDVIFWDDQSEIANKIMNEIFEREDVKNSNSILVADYADHALNRGITIHERLIEIEKLFVNYSTEFNL